MPGQERVQSVMAGLDLCCRDEVGFGFSPFHGLTPPLQMIASVSRLRRSAGLFALLLAALVLIWPQNASGQIWLQTARVLTPIEDGPRAFLDSLVNVMDKEDVMVKRSPDAKEPVKISELRNTLIDEEGIGLESANYAFIDYRFTIGNGGNFEQEVRRIHFVFRPGPQQNDVSVMYLNARKPWVKKVIHQKGTALQTNEAALIPFYRHLGFANIARQEESQVVEIGGETVRTEFDERKEALIRKVEELMYETFV